MGNVSGKPPDIELGRPAAPDRARLSIRRDEPDPTGDDVGREETESTGPRGLPTLGDARPPYLDPNYDNELEEVPMMMARLATEEDFEIEVDLGHSPFLGPKDGHYDTGEGQAGVSRGGGGRRGRQTPTSEEPHPDFDADSNGDELRESWFPEKRSRLEAVIDEETNPLLKRGLEDMNEEGEIRLRSGANGLPPNDVEDTTNLEKESVGATISTLKDLLIQERLSSRCYSKRLDPIFRTLIEVLDGLESMTVESSVPVHPNLTLTKKKRMLNEQLEKMTPIERNHVYCILFVLHSHLHTAATTGWQAEDGPLELRTQIEDVTKTVAGLLQTMSVDMASVLDFRREVSNYIWEMNRLYEVNSRCVDENLPGMLDGLSVNLMQLANSLLCSVIDRWILSRPHYVLWESMALSNREPSAIGDRSSNVSTQGDRETSLEGRDYESYSRYYVKGLKGLKVVDYALTKILCEERKNHPSGIESPGGQPSGGASLDHGLVPPLDPKDRGDKYISFPASIYPEEEEEVAEVLAEAVKMARALMEDGGGRWRHGDLCMKKVYKFPVGVKADDMFLTQFLSAKKFEGIADRETIDDINSLVRLNNVLAHLRWAVERLGGPSEDGGESQNGDQPQDGDDTRPFQIQFYSAGESDPETLEDDHIPSTSTRDPSRVFDRRFFSKGGRRRYRSFGDGENLSLDKAIGLVNRFKRGFRPRRIEGGGREWKGETGEGPEKMVKVAEDLSKGRSVFWYTSLTDKGAFEERLMNSYGRGKFGSTGRALAIDPLLFEKEKAALQVLSDSEKPELLENLDRVALPLKDKEVGYMGFPGNRTRKLPISLTGSIKPPEKRKMDALQESILSVKKTSIPCEKLRPMNIQLFFVALFPMLYLFDIFTDVYLAYDHLLKSNYLYFSLTFLFILGPMVAEVISKAALKLYGTEKLLTWKEVFSMESILLLPRSLKSFKYALSSVTDYDGDLKTFYTELNRLREKGDSLEEPAGGLKRRGTKVNNLDTWLIQSHFYAMMITNEKLLFNWKMADCLNESAPQLMLQIILAIVQFVDGEHTGIMTILGIISSLASLSWTMHLCHYYMHYDGLKNNFNFINRITDFIAHVLIVGARFAAISFVAALHPKIFFAICAFYLAARYVYLIYFSSTSWVYRLLSKNRTMFLWPIHRLYITPYMLRLWRCDVWDDVIYHLETFIVAISWPYLVAKDHPMGHLRWIVTATILLANFGLLPFLIKFNEGRHEPSRFCREDNPFWLGKHMAKRKEKV